MISKLSVRQRLLLLVIIPVIGGAINAALLFDTIKKVRVGSDLANTLTRQQELIAKQPTKAVGQPEDIANGIAFFASPRTLNVTGQILTLDGGRSMGIAVY